MPTTTDISTFTPAQQAAFKSAADLSGGNAQFTTTPPPPVTPAAPAATPSPVVAPTTATPEAPKTTTQTNDPNQDAVDKANEKLVADQNQQAADAKVFHDTLTGIQNGAIPLSPGDQAQIDGLKQQFQQLIDSQKLTNIGATGTANIRGYQAGAAEYDPTFQTKTIGAIASAGAAKVANLQTQEASAVATLTQALKDNNMKAAANAYAALNDAHDASQKALQTIVETVQKKIEAAQKAAQAAQEAQIAEEKRYYDQVTKPTQEITLIAQKFGAPPEVIAQMQQAASYEDAMFIAGQYLTDPKAKYELESAALENALKQEELKMAPLDRALKQSSLQTAVLDRSLKSAQLDKTRAETAQIGQPTVAEKKAQVEAQQKAATTIPLLKDKIALIDKISSDSGLSSAVGPNVFGRLAPIASFTGSKQSFIGDVNKLVNKETIDTLINLKAQGGTLGALSDQERILLQSAASNIGSWQITDKNGKVTGYDIDENAFKEELQTIKNLTQRAIDVAQGTLLPDSDKAVLDTLFGGQSSSNAADLQGFQPANYY